MKRMKKLFMLMLVLCMSLTYSLAVFAEQDGPDVCAESYCIMNIADGSIIMSKNMDEKYFPASITKVMTAIVTLEHCTNLDDKVVFNSEVMDSISANSSTLNPVAVLGEEMTVRDALFGLMLNSANECASALAVYTAGSISAFIDMMNEKAQEIGAVNTHYVNAHGLHDDDHYTTAHDMAIIFDYALKNDTFRYIDSSAEHTIPATNLVAERKCVSTNKLLNGNIVYDGVYAGKTGHTVEAGRTLVTAAYRNGYNLICVIMKSDNDNFYTDTEILLDFAFEKAQGNGSITFTAMDDTVSVSQSLSSGLRVRKYPSTLAPTVASLQPGESVHRLGTFGDWSKVETAGGVYYTATQYLVNADGTPAASGQTAAIEPAATMGEPELESKALDSTEETTEAMTQQEAENAIEETSASSAVTKAPENIFNDNEADYTYHLNGDMLTIIIIVVIIFIAIIIAILAISALFFRS